LDVTEGIQSQDAEAEGTPDVVARLSDIPPERLVEEVISRWDELVRVEEDLALSRQRVRALEMELVDQGDDGSLRGRVAELEEALRVANARIAQMEGLLENERRRRGDLEEGVGQGRVKELQEENVRLLRSEEEQMMLILDMEAQLDRLVSQLEEG
jgi:ABC-type phosphate transport system auxiliary subunit